MYCKGIYSNLDYIYTPSLTSYWISNGEMWKFTIRTEPWVHAHIKREFTLIRSVNSRLFDTIIHAYSMREFTLIRCVNSCLFDAWINACTNRELTLVRSDVRGFRGSCFFKSRYFAWPEYFLQPQPTATTGLRLKFISLILLVFLMIT